MDQNVKKYKFYCLDAQHCSCEDPTFSLHLHKIMTDSRLSDAK